MNVEVIFTPDWLSVMPAGVKTLSLNAPEGWT